MNVAPHSVVDYWPKMCPKLKYNQNWGDVFEKDEYMIMMTVMLIIIMNEGSGVGSQVPSLEVGEASAKNQHSQDLGHTWPILTEHDDIYIMMKRLVVCLSRKIITL